MADIIPFRRPTHPHGEPLGSLLDEHYARVCNRGARPASVRQMRYISGWLGRELAGVKVEELLQPDSLERYFTGPCLRAGRSPAGVNAAVKFLRSALRARHLPYEHLHLAAESKRLPQVMVPAEVAAVISTAPCWLQTVIRLAWRSGLRRGELARLHFEDLEAGHVRVTARDGWVPKDHEERRVPAPSGLLAELRKPGAAGPMFPGPSGGCLSESSLDKAFRSALRSAGMYRKGHGLHALRRTWATELLAAGADVNHVRRWGGWSSLVTMQQYLGVVENHARDAVEKLGC